MKPLRKSLKPKIEVEKRSVYPRYGRKRIVWDARGTLRGVEYCITAAPTRAAAIAEAIEEVEYLETAGFYEAGGCSVRCNGTREWGFWIGGRCVMNYGAPDLTKAVLRAAESYHEHPECREFCSAVTAYLGPA